MTTNMDMCAKATAVVEKKKSLNQSKKKKYEFTALDALRIIFCSWWLLKCCYASAACSIIAGPSWMGIKRLRDKGLSQGPLTPVSVWNSDGVPQSVQYSGMSDTPSGLCLPQ